MIVVRFNSASKVLRFCDAYFPTTKEHCFQRHKLGMRPTKTVSHYLYILWISRRTISPLCIINVAGDGIQAAYKNAQCSVTGMCLSVNIPTQHAVARDMFR